MFRKFEISRVSFISVQDRTIDMIVFGFIRVFERGECRYKDLFKGEVSTYESNIPYILRFMIDTKVSL